MASVKSLMKSIQELQPTPVEEFGVPRNLPPRKSNNKPRKRKRV